MWLTWIFKVFYATIKINVVALKVVNLIIITFQYGDFSKENNLGQFLMRLFLLKSKQRREARKYNCDTPSGLLMRSIFNPKLWMTLKVFISLFFNLCVGFWPLWSIFTPFILGTLFMGFMFFVTILPVWTKLITILHTWTKLTILLYVAFLYEHFLDAMSRKWWLNQVFS